MPNLLQKTIVAIILISAIYASVNCMKRCKDAQQGFPPEHELSTLIKYKAGHYAFPTSM